jgi:MOSC domain
LLPPKSHTYPLETFSIWYDIPQALNYGRHVPPDFKRYLQIPESTPFTLFRVSPSHYRTIYRNAPRKGDGDGQVPYQPITAFADSYPLHLQNIASVRDVAERVKDQLPRFTSRRFRANILVAGPDKPYDEDGWKRIRVHPTPTSSSSSSPHLASPTGEEDERRTDPIDFHTACHTIRCKLPNVDPDTAYRHEAEPDKTLRSFRRIDSGDRNKAALGLQLVPAKAGNDAVLGGEDQMMQLRVGDLVEVLERGELVYIKAGLGA